MGYESQNQNGLHYHPSDPFLFCGSPYSPFEIYYTSIVSDYHITSILVLLCGDKLTYKTFYNIFILIVYISFSIDQKKNCHGGKHRYVTAAARCASPYLHELLMFPQEIFNI